ncbi:MAG: NAD(P)/FAD-dependent oxidoreductase [Patescibacteria group bacterium]
MLKPHILILGAGFGGTYVAKRLAPYVKSGKIEVTLVNRTNYFLFTPLLHEVATGALSPTSVAEPLREIFHGTGVRIAQGTVESVDLVAKKVKLNGSTSCTLSYDHVVIATGAETNYYGISGADKFTYPLKDLADAARIRSQVIDAFERALLISDPVERARLLSFVVVGGGATGVETAAELAEFVHGMVKRYYGVTKNCAPNDSRTCKPEEPLVTLIHTGPEILQMFAPSLRVAAEKRLRRSGVELSLNATVTEVTSQGIKLSSGASIPSSTVIWAAGVKAIIPHFEGAMPVVAGGRLVVDEYFRLGGDSSVFALGDVAGYLDPVARAADPTKAKPLPMLAQVASQEARMVADNLSAVIRRRTLKSFSYHSKGSMVSVGQWFAVGEILSLKIAGRLTWWVWRTIYLFKFASWKKRLRIAFEWTLEIFYPRDITKLT